MARIAYPLRIDEATMDAVKRTAAADLRSVNAQLEVLIREALRRRGATPGTGTKGVAKDAEEGKDEA